MTEKQVFIIWMESLHKDVSTDSDGKFTDPETEARFRGWLGRADVQRAVEQRDLATGLQLFSQYRGI